MDKKLYVQYGAGSIAIPGWINFDSSPTLRVQRVPILGRILQKKLNCIFDDEIFYGDIIKGLPVKPSSVDGLFCSHVLEHLTYTDFHTALSNSFNYLKSGGVFRVIVPDLEFYIRQYINVKNDLSIADNLRDLASIDFMKLTCLGENTSRSSLSRRLYEAFSNSHHRWMWDYGSMVKALSDHGFINIKRFRQGESSDDMFLLPERDYQFGEGVNLFGLALQCNKP